MSNNRKILEAQVEFCQQSFDYRHTLAFIFAERLAYGQAILTSISVGKGGRGAQH